MSTVGGLQSKGVIFFIEGCFNIFNSRGIVNVVSCITDDEQIQGIFIIEIGRKLGCPQSGLGKRLLP